MKTQILEQAGLSSAGIIIPWLIAVGAIAGIALAVYQLSIKKESRNWAPTVITLWTFTAGAISFSLGIVAYGGFFDYKGTVTVTAMELQDNGGKLVEVEESDQTFYLKRETQYIVRVGDVLELTCDDADGSNCSWTKVDK